MTELTNYITKQAVILCNAFKQSHFKGWHMHTCIADSLDKARCY